MRLAVWLMSTLLLFPLCSPSRFFLNTLPAVCSSFGYNWAAEIRCLRNLLSQCSADGRSPGNREVRDTDTVLISTTHPSLLPKLTTTVAPVLPTSTTIPKFSTTATPGVNVSLRTLNGSLTSSDQRRPATRASLSPSPHQRHPLKPSTRKQHSLKQQPSIARILPEEKAHDRKHPVHPVKVKTSKLVATTLWTPSSSTSTPIPTFWASESTSTFTSESTSLFPSLQPSITERSPPTTRSTTPSKITVNEGAIGCASSAYSSESVFGPSLPPLFSLQLLRVNLTRELNGKLNELTKHLEERLREFRGKADSNIAKLEKRIRLLTSRVFLFDQSEYIIVDQPESWYEAEEKCVIWGGHLVSILNIEENRFITKISRGRAVWIAANDVQQETLLVNTDGTQVHFTNWRQGEPDNANHNENCVEVEGEQGLWSDSFCFLTKEFICKR